MPFSSLSLSLLTRSSAPLATVTSTDKAGVIVIVSALCLAFALVSLLIRLYVRLQSRPNPVGWDDALVIGAFVISIFQSACIFFQVRKGLGKTISQVDPSNLITIQKAAYADDILYILAVWLTKISVAILFLRLSPKRGHKVASSTDVISAAVTAFISIMIIALRCDLSHPWISLNSRNATCTGLFARWQTVAAFDIFLEVLIFATSIYLFKALHLPFSKKVNIASAFASRLLLIAPIALRLHYLAPALNSSNYTLDVTTATLCKQVEISYAIIAATLPCLRPFMTATVTYYGGAAEGHRSSQGIYGSNNRSNSSGQSRSQKNIARIRLTNLTSRLSGGQSDDSEYLRSLSAKLDWDHSQSSHTVSAAGGDGSWARNLRTAESSESKQVMVRTEIERTVEYRSSEGTDAERDSVGLAV